MNFIRVDYKGSLYFGLYMSLSLCVYWQVLQQKFEDFLHDLNSSEDRITSVTAMATEMIEAKHFESEAIKKRSEEVVHQWNELKEVAKARQEVRLFLGSWNVSIDKYIRLFFMCNCILCRPW